MTPHNKLPDERRQEVAIHLKATKDTFADTARRFGISRTTVANIAREQEIATDPIAIDVCDYLPSPREIAEAAQEVRDGWSPQQEWSRRVDKRERRGIGVYAIEEKGATVLGFKLIG